MKEIVLASSSPRRQELFRKLHIPFTVDPGDFVEDMTLQIPPEVLVKKLALGKARSVVPRHPSALIIGADTLIAFGGSILGKPHSPERALEMLTLLNGKKHSVWTGFAVIDTTTGKIEERAIETKVQFKTVSENELHQYIQTGEPLDRAGGYAIQEKGAFLVQSYEGDYDTIVGLPVRELAQSLANFGVHTEI